MQIVIEIPKTLKEIADEEDIKTFSHFIWSAIIMDAIKNGTPIPKGHGKIIAEPTEEDIAKTVGGQNDFAECIKDAVKAVFDNAPTIIEADRSEEE
jgi:hypothetical protein